MLANGLFIEMFLIAISIVGIVFAYTIIVERCKWKRLAKKIGKDPFKYFYDKN